MAAEDIQTLLFDVLGTVVDEAGSMRAELAAAPDLPDASRQADSLAAAQRRRADDSRVLAGVRGVYPDLAYGPGPSMNSTADPG